jgi:hypothetical protein
MSTLEGFGTMAVTNATKVSPYYPVSKPLRRDHAPLSGGLEGSSPNLYTKGLCYLNKINRRLPKTLPRSYNTKDELWGDFLPRVLRTQE